MSGVFGKAKFGGKGRNWFKIKDGSNGPYRILPPMGDLSEDGRWSAFYRIHYGYKNSEGKMRTFQSPLIQNRKTKMVESPDAALDFITKLKVKLDDAKKAGNTELANKIMELVGGKKSRYNLDSNHYLNVVDLQNNIGILKIRHRCKLALDAEIKKLRDNGTDPLDPETGRFFTFHRSGMGMDTVYSVSVYKEKLNVKDVGEVERDITHQITDEIARRCLVQNKDGSFTYKEAGRLDSLFAKPTSEEVDRIVREGEKAVDEILDSKANENTETDDGGLEDDEAVTTQTASGAALAAAAASVGVTPQTAAPATPAAVSTAVAQTVVSNPPVDTAVTVTTSTPVVVQTTTPVTTPVAQATAPKTTAQKVEEQTDEEFLKSLGL